MGADFEDTTDGVPSEAIWLEYGYEMQGPIRTLKTEVEATGHARTRNARAPAASKDNGQRSLLIITYKGYIEVKRVIASFCDNYPAILHMDPATLDDPHLVVVYCDRPVVEGLAAKTRGFDQGIPIGGRRFAVKPPAALPFSIAIAGVPRRSVREVFSREWLPRGANSFVLSTALAKELRRTEMAGLSTILLLGVPPTWTADMLLRVLKRFAFTTGSANWIDPTIQQGRGSLGQAPDNMRMDNRTIEDFLLHTNGVIGVPWRGGRQLATPKFRVPDDERPPAILDMDEGELKLALDYNKLLGPEERNDDEMREEGERAEEPMGPAAGTNPAKPPDAWEDAHSEGGGG